MARRRPPANGGQEDLMADDDVKPLSFSFAAAGWLKMYYFGVGLALQHYGLHKKARFAGSSAGALVGAALVMERDFLKIKDFAMRCIDHVHGAWHRAFQLRRYVLECIEENVNQEVFDQRKTDLEERLEVSVTILPGCHNRRFTEFPTMEFFQKALLASCTATPIAGFPFKLDGEWVLDGGVSDFQPLVDQDSITVSPFYFHRTDIKPSQFVPLWWAVYPPSREEFERLFQLGYDDAIAWMDANGHRRPDDYKAPDWLVPTPVNPEEVKAAERERERKQSCDADRNWIETARPPTAGHRKPKREILMFQPGPGAIQSPSSRGFVSDLLDFLLFFFIVVVVKPTSYLLIYMELALLTGVAFMRALLHDVLPTFSNRTRRGAWHRVEQYFRTIASFSLLARALIGPTVVMDKERLFEQSVVFRLMVFAL